MAGTLLFKTESFRWALQAACEILHKPVAAELLTQQIPPPYSELSLQQGASLLGLKSRWRAAHIDELAALPLPCIAALRATSESILRGGALNPVPDPNRLGLLIQCGASHVVYVPDGEQRPVRISRSDFASIYGGHVMLIAAQPAPSTDAQDTAPQGTTFGFRWFVPELLKHRRIWREVLAASLAIQLMALATPLCTQIVIDKVIVHQTTNTLVVVALALLMFVVFTAGMTWIRQYLVLHTGNRIDAVLGSQVFEHLFRLPPAYFERRPTGTLVARMQGVETIRDFVTGASVTLLLDVPFLLIFLAIMFYYSVTLTLIAMAALALITALSAAVTPLLRERLNEQFLLGARNQAFLTEYVSGMDTVKSLQLEPQLSRRYGDYLAGYLQAGFRTRQLSNSYNVAASSIEQLLALTILCAGAWIVMTTQDMTIGMLVAFQMFASRLSGPVLRMVGLWQEFQQASIAVKRLGDIMDAVPDPYTAQPARTGSGRGRIELRDLSFRYAENLPYLFRGLDVAIEPGECVAITGPSGSGKSTLAKLMQGFCQPTEGAIWLDGHDIRHLAANELRQHFGVVPQDTVLFSGTLYDNLILANPHATFADIIAACESAEIHSTIERLPQGYQTPVGEHGSGLSGGQRQRIAIARALLKRPRILIFDEATNGLDAETVEQFARTVNRLKGATTLIFISHGLPEVLAVDRVVSIGGGASGITPTGRLDAIEAGAETGRDA